LGLAPASNNVAYVTNPTIYFDPLGLAPGCDGERGPFDFREPNPEFPPNPTAIERMRSAPIGGNIDCSEIAEYIARGMDGEGKIVNFTSHGAPKVGINIPERGGPDFENYTYHDVYTDGKYVYDPAMSRDPIPYGDYERAIRLLNPDQKIIVSNGGYKGPLW
jgi:hypothetical protein